MTRDEIIGMAREAQLICESDTTTPWIEDVDLTPYLESFAQLIAFSTREECAKVCEAYLVPGIANEMARVIRARN